MEYKILVVDDEADLVGLIKKILETEGYIVSTASSGEECLYKIKNEKFDLILLDIMMPGMNGWDVFNKIKKQDYFSKVVFVSVLDISEKRKRFLINEGLADYITKPFTDEDLLRSVNSVLVKSKKTNLAKNLNIT